MDRSIFFYFLQEQKKSPFTDKFFSIFCNYYEYNYYLCNKILKHIYNYGIEIWRTWQY